MKNIMTDPGSQPGAGFRESVRAPLQRRRRRLLSSAAVAALAAIVCGPALTGRPLEPPKAYAFVGAPYIITADRRARINLYSTFSICRST